MNRDEIIQAAKDEIAKDAKQVSGWKSEQWHAVAFVVIVVFIVAAILYAGFRLM